MNTQWPVIVENEVSPCGTVKIERFSVSEEEASMHNIRSAYPYQIKEGDYTSLIIDSDVVMSNTPMEIKTNSPFTSLAEGNILINGLGIGMVLEELLKKNQEKNCIEHITVIEINPLVIQMVGKYYADNPLITIIEASAFDYKPPKEAYYDYVWHDIWTFICADNVKEMSKLHRKYGRKCGWQGSWARNLCEYYRKEEKKNYF